MAGEPYFLVPHLPQPGEFVLDGDEGKHAATVLRIRVGEHLVLTDGNGARADAAVTAATRGAVTLQVDEYVTDARPSLTVVLVQALPKGERSDLAVDQATQAGVDEIIPWQSERCVAKWSSSADKAQRGRDKWLRTVTSATKQSRRSRIPIVHGLADTATVIEQVHASDMTIALHEVGATPLADLPLPAAGRLMLIVGPEGGLSPDEVMALGEAGAVSTRLGPEVLRSSAAAAVALGAIGALTARWG